MGERNMSSVTQVSSQNTPIISSNAYAVNGKRYSDIDYNGNKSLFNTTTPTRGKMVVFTPDMMTNSIDLLLPQLEAMGGVANFAQLNMIIAELVGEQRLLKKKNKKRWSYTPPATA